MLQIILPPHLKVALKVTNPAEILKDAGEMLEGLAQRWYITKGGLNNYAFSVAHPQVSDRPRRFFVINPEEKSIAAQFGGHVIVNPHIIQKDKETRFIFRDACLSYPFRPGIKVKRYNTIHVSYSVLVLKDKSYELMPVPYRKLERQAALVFEHEFEHLNGKSIYS